MAISLRLAEDRSLLAIRLMKKILLIIFIVVSIALVLSSCENIKISEKARYEVLKVIDGDTINVLYDNRDTPVRYIGIDTPETHGGSDKAVGEYGDEAYQFNDDLIKRANNTVYLEFDKDLYGTYHRLLAYVYVDSNGTKVMINSQLIKEGLAWPLTYTDTSKHTREFWEDYSYAYHHRLGMFSKYDTAPTVEASIVDQKLWSYKSGGYLGKLVWVKFGPVHYHREYSSITLSSTYFSVTIRTPELGEFATPLNVLYAGKILKVYGEVWEKHGKGQMLLHAPFEIKVLRNGGSEE